MENILYVCGEIKINSILSVFLKLNHYEKELFITALLHEDWSFHVGSVHYHGLY